MKKLLALLLCGVMLLAFAACGDKPETPDAPDAVDTEDTPPAAKEFEVTTATSGNFEITVLGAEAVTTRDDTAGIRIYYEFTNNATYTVKGVDDVPATATQNGETLNSVFANEMIDIDTTKELFGINAEEVTSIFSLSLNSYNSFFREFLPIDNIHRIVVSNESFRLRVKSMPGFVTYLSILEAICCIPKSRYFLYIIAADSFFMPYFLLSV